MNIGIIGLGRIGMVHLKAIEQINNVKTVAVSDVNEQLCKETAKRLNIAHYYTDFESIVSNKKIDAVWVCSPSDLHYTHVSEALKNGKYVFCEKPLEVKIGKIQSLLDMYSDIDRRLMIGFNRRFDPDFSFLKQNITTLGKPTIIKITSRDPTFPPDIQGYLDTSGGIFKDMTIHDLDMARFISESEVEYVCAVGAINYEKAIQGKDVDTSLVTLKFKNDILCTIDNSRVSAYGYDQRLEVHGYGGMICASNHKVNQCTVYSKESVSSSVFKNFFLERYEKAYQNQINAFYNSVEQAKEFPVTAYDALKALEIAEACGKSLKENRMVRLK